MQKWKIAGIALMLCAVNRVSAQQDNYERRVKEYIEQFKTLAIQEQKRSGIPAAITLAQGIHETSAGNSELATEANNHFGIKCKKEWRGMTFAHTDDAVDECFRKYGKAEESYADHSNYLKGSPRYAALFTLSPTDYAGWAVGLKRCGYATNPQYSRVLIKLIEEYHLQDYTYAALGDDDFNPVKAAQKVSDGSIPSNKPGIVPNNDAAPPRLQIQKKTNLQVSYNAKQAAVEKEATDEVLEENPATPVYNKLVKVNGLKAFYAKKGTLLLNDAFKHNMRYAHLLELNDLPDAPIEADMYIYLEKKNSKGPRQLHVVKPGESLTQVAQIEGIQLKYLKYYNHIGANEEPVAGALLQLQEYSEDKPETVAKEDAKRIQALSFEGDAAPVIAQGATRKSSKYMRKPEVVAAIQAEATPPPPTPAERRELRLAAARAKKEQEAKDKAERERIKRELASTEEDAIEETPATTEAVAATPTGNAKPIGAFRKEMGQSAAHKEHKPSAPPIVASAAEPAAILKETKTEDIPAPVMVKEASKPAAEEPKVVAEEPKSVAEQPKQQDLTEDPKVVAEEPKKQQAKSVKGDMEVIAEAKKEPEQLFAAKENDKPAKAEVTKPEPQEVVKEEPKAAAAIEPKVEPAAEVPAKDLVVAEDVPEVKKEDILANQYPVEEIKAPVEPAVVNEEAKAAAVGEHKAIAPEEKNDGPESASKEEASPAKQDDLAVLLAAKKGASEASEPAPTITETKQEPAVAEEPKKETAEPNKESAVTEENRVPVEEPMPQPKTVDLALKADEPPAQPADAVAKEAVTPTTEPAPVEAPPTPVPPVEPVKPKEPEEPMDEFARLKAQLDKVVYASNDAPPPPKATPAPEAKKEAPKKETTKKETDPKSAKKGKLYTVRKGDTAFIIARRNNITMKQLQEWNNLDFQTIKEGQQLRVSK